MARVVRHPSAQRREQMTPEYGSDAGSNVLQLQYAKHSCSVVFRLRCGPTNRRRTQPGKKEDPVLIAVSIGGYGSGSVVLNGQQTVLESFVPILHLTGVRFGCIVTKQSTLSEPKSQLFRLVKQSQQQEVK